MPTLRRSKSLNDKISRQKSRTSSDVIRDPRSPEVEGRTKQCVDNFQALVHLRRQTEDKARQLDLAFNYVAGGHSRRIPPGGVELPYQENRPFERNHIRSSIDVSGSGSYQRLQPEVPRAVRGEAEVVTRHQRLQMQHQHESSSQKGPRPVSMYERRPASIFTSPDELARKDQMIQNLIESQRLLGNQNESLAHRIDELQFQNSQLKEMLNACNMEAQASLRNSAALPAGTPDVAMNARLEGKQRLNVPQGDNSVSGYGSLVDDLEKAHEPAVNMESTGQAVEAFHRWSGYEDKRLASESSTTSPDLGMVTLTHSSSSGESSRMHTPPRDSDIESLHEKLDRVLQHNQNRDTTTTSKLKELKVKVEELTNQNSVLLERFKAAVDQNYALQRRDEHVHAELRALLHRHGLSLRATIRTELQAIQQKLTDTGQDIQNRIEKMLAALAPRDPHGGHRAIITQELAEVRDQIIDLVGPEYMQLGRKLGLPTPDLEKIEASHNTLGEKTRQVLERWVRMRGGNINKAAEELTNTLMDMDKDIRHFAHTPVSGPERQTLRTCLQHALDHVIDPQRLLDQLISLNEFTPAEISFVREVGHQPERALARMWHVSEYRGTGVVSRLALALERSGDSYVSKQLTDELEIQNSKLHSQSHSAALQEKFHKEPSISFIASAALPMHLRSRSESKLPRPRSYTESAPLALGERNEVWHRQMVTPNGPRVGSSRGRGIVQEGDRISRV